MTPDEVSEALRLADLKHATWAIFPTSAVSGEGIDAAMQWIAAQCK